MAVQAETFQRLPISLGNKVADKDGIEQNVWIALTKVRFTHYVRIISYSPEDTTLEFKS